MIIVGVGAGPQMLTGEAAAAVARARLIYGSQRAIDLAREHISPEAAVHVIEDYRALKRLPEEAVVLSTGDPMLSGLGYLHGRVIPGISSMQVACARLKVSQLRVIPITVHGRSLDPEAIAFELSRDRCVFLLTDEGTDLEGLCRFLEERGLHRDVAALSDLGYPQEREVRGDTAHPPRAPGLSCVMIGRF
ncbi:MAG TPA: cobalt-precorrin-7 (C(5))-methyltransferase [Methanothrix sp.]|nr:cobalt-precorrin-7 (C(5))-methyltransferase [Methanothrix sp.]HPT19499.1 cobalt-precorrin-7 (C(5))-methyltransferase [Methanothrix sp.]